MKKMKLLSLLLLITTFTLAQQSPRMKAEGAISDIRVIVDYGAPSVRGRTIWGDLEAYGKVWRAGANENTTVSFDKDAKIGGKTLPAGKYGFFIIPNEKSEWVIIFNKTNNAWGATSYKQADDALRINVKPEFVDEVQEQLKFTVSSGSIDMAWDKTRLSIPVSK